MTAPFDPNLERRTEAATDPADTTYQLTLFVSGASQVSARAILNARHLCDIHLGDQCQLAVVDVNDDPGAALTSGVVTIPTLVRTSPLPVRRVAGDLSDTNKVLMILRFRDVSVAAKDSSAG